MISVYVWEGEVQKEPEYLLLIKTLPEKWDELQRFIAENHTYEVPEIVAIDTAKVSESYEAWLREVLPS
jgi:periplasmic divalent cation tolerance protein